MRAPPIKLSHRIVMAALVSATVLLVLVGGVAYHLARSNVVESTDAALERQASQFAAEVWIRLRAAAELARTGGKVTVLRSVLSPGEGGATESFDYLADVRLAALGIEAFIVVDANGNTLSALGSDALPDVVRTSLARFGNSGRATAIVTDAPSGPLLWLILPFDAGKAAPRTAIAVVAIAARRLLSSYRIERDYEPPNLSRSLVFTDPLDGRLRQIHAAGPVGDVVAESGDHRQSATAPILLGAVRDSLNLSVRVAGDQNHLSNRLSAVTVPFVSVGLGAVILVAVAGWWAGWRLTFPVERRSDATAAALADGGPGTGASESGEDKIARSGAPLGPRPAPVTDSAAHSPTVEERFRLFFDSWPAAFQLKNLSGRYLFVNRTYRKWFGKADDELLGRYPSDVWPDTVARAAESDHREVVEGQKTVFREVDVPTADGSWQPMLVMRFPVFDEMGRMTCVGATYTNFTERRRTEARMRAVFANSLMGIALYTPDKRWIEFNETLCRMFGYTRAELQSLTWVDLTHPDDIAPNLRLFEDAFAGGTDVYHLRKRFIGKDGSILHAEINVQCLRRADGQPDYFLLLVQDISEKIRAEQDLARMQKLDAIGQLTGGVAHDFNNLLQVIIGNAGLIKEPGCDARTARPAAEQILQAATRGAELTHRLLAFARQQPLDPTNVDVCALAKGLEPLLRRALGEQFDIRLRLPAVPMSILVDAVQLESAVLNLAVNARDAMADGGTITIEVADVNLDEHYCQNVPYARPGRHILLAVSDTGTGIPSEIVDRVFEPFFTTKEPGKGTGLGLSMVYGFVKQSGGHVNVYSEPGHGTTIKLYFPRADSDVASTANDADTNTGPPPAGSESVLVVEDNDLVRKFVIGYLEALGYCVIGVSGGSEALARLAEPGVSVDVVVSDVVMSGGMSGPQLIAEIRRSYPGIKAGLTSGFAHEAAKIKSSDAPDVPILPKPYQGADLAQFVRKIIDGAT